MAINLKRRKAVMSRSVKLGHCVCDPQKPCPCDEMKEFNVCHCAGERMPRKEQDVRLTQHVHKAGCASKIGQADLLRVLANLPPVTDPNVLVGTAAGDDAGVYRLDDGRALVQTVDVFTPCVDEPYLFGQIAAANSVSDVYAMGGRPVTALSVIGYPIDTLDDTGMQAMLRGGIDKLNEAGCPLIGGHSINDQEVKFGFAVTGLIDAGSAVERDRAQAGDAIVLTKPLGTGMVAFAAQIGRASDAALEAVGASMATLNKDAAELMVELDAHACTDVTGYALAGHLVQMARGSGVDAEIDLSRVPVFAAAKACLEREIFPGAIERNQEYAMAWVDVRDGQAEGNVPILYDPQTSGGLLIALPEGRAKTLVKELRARGHDAASIIGCFVEKKEATAEGRVIVTNTLVENLIGDPEREVIMDEPVAKDALSAGKVVPVPQSEEEEPACCASPPVFDDEEAPKAKPSDSRAAAETLALFQNFMKAANKPGLVDGKHKKLMAIALSISQHCEPCLRIHMKTALDMGISWAEIDEVANLATAFGGCTAMMFYKEMKDSLRKS